MSCHKAILVITGMTQYLHDNTLADFIKCMLYKTQNSTLYKTHKPNIPVKLLTRGYNTAFENLAIFAEKHCPKLTENIPTKIND